MFSCVFNLTLKTEKKKKKLPGSFFDKQCWSPGVKFYTEFSLSSYSVCNVQWNFSGCKLLLWIVGDQYTVRILGCAQNLLSCAMRKGQRHLSICSSTFRLATDCTTPKLLGALGVIPVARWCGVSSMACSSLLPSLRAPCLLQKLGRTVVMLRGLCHVRSLPFSLFSGPFSIFSAWFAVLWKLIPHMLVV